MAHSNTVLSQILRIFPRHEFEALCRKHPSAVQMRTFSNWTQFVAMLTAQLAGLDSLRSIVDTFSTQLKRFYHLVSSCEIIFLREPCKISAINFNDFCEISIK